MTSKLLQKFALGGRVALRGCRTSASSGLVYTDKLSFINERYAETIPAYAVLSNASSLPSVAELKLDEPTLLKMYTTMVSISVMDTILYESQRQGRISFYMTNYGEEAVQIGSAAALDARDLIYSQYRESGILLWRGYTFSDFISQCYGNSSDKNKGRQMPVHYGSRELNFVTVSSPLTTQLPQAVGAAYGLKELRSDACVVCYFGEGAASEGDAHAAFNFAATLDCPVIFVCRNNGYAISTPSRQQYKGDGIAAKGPAYGISTIRVDGNDIFAVYNATRLARAHAAERRKPVLIEAMTYRIGHHSTSDDSTAYRSSEEIDAHAGFAPIARLRKYLEHVGLWDRAKEEELTGACKKTILGAILQAEREAKPSWKELFSDVYHDVPEHIGQQRESLERHIKKYSDKYPILNQTADL